MPSPSPAQPTPHLGLSRIDTTSETERSGRIKSRRRADRARDRLAGVRGLSVDRFSRLASQELDETDNNSAQDHPCDRETGGEQDDFAGRGHQTMPSEWAIMTRPAITMA